ncbi:MAG: hypothetical protein DME77_06670 [Verrucomicrobia bacterium]|nr:MAG: hypothetical protein DME77_06670 [Verrucomicrobiota bacterium]
MAILLMQPCLAYPVSRESCANIRHQTGKNLRPHNRSVHPKFLPQRGTCLIVDPTYRVMVWSAVDRFSKQRKQRASPDKNNRERALVHRALQVPSASHGVDWAPF